jgi:hypothetical protein
VYSSCNCPSGSSRVALLTDLFISALGGRSLLGVVVAREVLVDNQLQKIISQGNILVELLHTANVECSGGVWLR